MSPMLQMMIIRKFSRQLYSKAFSEIPAPRGLPFVGTTLSLLAAGSTTQLHRYIDNRHKKYGPIFREKIGPANCVFLSDPTDMRAAFAQEGKYPSHILPESWTLYNDVHGCSRGLFFMDGEEWLQYRKIMNKLLLKGDLSWIDTACDLVSKIMAENIETGIECTNLEETLYLLSLDAIVAILVGSKNFTNLNYEVKTKIHCLGSSVHNIFKTSEDLNLIPIKIAFHLKIPRWKRFEKSVTSALKHGNDLVLHLSQQCSGGEGLLGKLENEMNSSLVSRIVTDLVLAAGDTTAYAMEWILYLLSKHKIVQKKLREDLISQETGIKSSYLRNVVRESLRLYPVAPFLTRIMPNNATIRGFDIPKGTLVVMSIFTSGRDPLYFSDAEKFLPERWAKTEEPKATNVASLPFAIGARSCVGKKIAESLLQSSIANIIKKFQIELCNTNEIDVVMKMVAVPSEPIIIKFTRI